MPSSRKIFSAWARLTSSFGPLTATSIGAGAPKLITSLTMSAGTKETCSPCTRSAMSDSETPSDASLPRRYFIRCAGNDSRSFSFRASVRMPLPGLKATRSTASSGPLVHR